MRLRTKLGTIEVAPFAQAVVLDTDKKIQKSIDFSLVFCENFVGTTYSYYLYVMWISKHNYSIK